MARRLERSGFQSGMLIAATLLALPACGDSRFQKVYKVSGQVLLDGKPVTGVSVRFIPKDSAKFAMAETPQGATDADGRFTLSTYYTGDGAPAGEYLVAVAYDGAPAQGDEDDTAPPKKGRQGRPRLPAVYQVPQKSGLTAQVEKKDNQLAPFELSGKAR